ncbi:MAG: GNAT family N-acetyltransferase [Candidatus Thiodiazotropha sp. (ex Monitilora ramsayi)]|nr:GNAT family N-acetyltransferase [Candidatus Thiodiazotropha sp. (ex Monitilora ramsayi)]
MFTLKEIDNSAVELLSALSIEAFIQAYEGVHSKSDLEAYCRDNYSVDSTESLLNTSETEAVVAFQGSDPAVFYVLKHHSCPVELAGQSTEQKQIYVLSEHFGGGLGRQLCESAVNKARKNKSKCLWLCVSDLNYRAQAFYGKTGFSKIGQGPELIVGNDILSSSIMVLSIEAAHA